MVSFRLVTTCPGLTFSGNSIVWPCQLWRTFRSWDATLRRSACTSRPTQWRKWSETTVCINTVLIIYTVNQTLFCDLLVNYFHNKANSYEYRLKQIQKTPRDKVHSSNICTEDAFMNLAKLSCIHIKLVYSNSPILMIHLHLQSSESILG